MAKFWWMALALMISAGLWAAPAMAQSEADDVGTIQRGGAEGSADTTLGKKGLVFTTDGFELRVTTRVQFRLTYQNEVANGSNGTNGRDFINFRIRRAKTKFSGHIFEKEFQYELLLDWTAGGSTIVEEAWFRWAVMQYINITAGQAKTPFNWEELSSSGSLQHVERSYVNEVFNEDYAKGLTIDGQVGEDTPWLKYWVGIYNGVLKSGTDYRNADKQLQSDSFSNLVDGEMMINLRLETHPLGEVKRGMNDMRGEDEYSQVIFAIGLGVNWFLSGYDSNTYAGVSDARLDTSLSGTTASGRFRTSQDTLSATIDGHFRWHGLSVDAAFFWRHTEFHNRGNNTFDPTSGAGIGNITDSGFTFEVAYMILVNQLSVGVRFDMLNADDFWSNTGNARVFGNRPDTTEIGLSVNYYIQGDNLKLTLDIIMVSQQLPVAAANGGLDGVYNDPPSRAAFGGGVGGVNDADHNDLWIIRLQLQWIF